MLKGGRNGRWREILLEQIIIWPTVSIVDKNSINSLLNAE